MLHFSCDLCGCRLHDGRYVVKMEVFPAFDPAEIDEQDLDSDHLEEISDLLGEMEAVGECCTDDCETKQLRFDLCTECRKKFLEDPLARAALQRFDFSEN